MREKTLETIKFDSTLRAFFKTKLIIIEWRVCGKVATSFNVNKNKRVPNATFVNYHFKSCVTFEFYGRQM